MNDTFTPEGLSLIEEHVRRLLDCMGFNEASVSCRYSGEEITEEGAAEATRLSISIDAGDEGRLLIGMHGQHLPSLQYVIRSILKRSFTSNILISLDVNNYRVRRERALVSLAESSARRAKDQGRTVVLNAMNAFDRRAIHTALATWDGIKTESMGEEPNRRVVIKPSLL